MKYKFKKISTKSAPPWNCQQKKYINWEASTSLTLNSEMALISDRVNLLLCIVGLKQDLILHKNVALCWSGACTRALENQKDIRPTLTHGGGGGG